MSYTKQIFNEMKAIDPNITVREFSYRCGKGEGYYGSLISQKLELSDEAIINLLETLEMWKLITVKTPNNTVDKIHQIDDVQKNLTTELAERTSTNHNTLNNQVRNLIIKAVVNLYQSKTNADTSIPFVF
jgi:RPA family protein